MTIAGSSRVTCAVTCMNSWDSRCSSKKSAPTLCEIVSTTMSQSQYLYKILDSDPGGQPLPDMLPSTELDTLDDFIHLSTAEQTPITAKLFFSTQDTLWILRLAKDRLDGRILYSTDPSAGVVDGCAHLHDSIKGLGKDNIDQVIVWSRDAKEDWQAVGQRQRLE